MPFKHYIQRIEGKVAETPEQYTIIKVAGQYSVLLPEHVQERANSFYNSSRGTWGLWRNSPEEAIKWYEETPEEQLVPLGHGGILLFTSRYEVHSYV